ncbi:MAG: hypothetical protein RR386_08245 [Bacteroidaceae bacterium]
MNLLVMALSVALLFLIVLSVKLNLKKKMSELIVRNVPFYTFVANDKVEVLSTNYYDINVDAPRTEPIILGNVLQCKNACDSGCCGTHSQCNHCVIRSSIVKSFTTNQPFYDVEAHLKLYNRNHEAVDTDVAVTGKPLLLKGEPHILLSVRDITTYKALQHRFIENEYKLNHLIREKDLYLKLVEELGSDTDGKLNIVARIEKEKDELMKFDLAQQKVSDPIRSVLPTVLMVTTDDEMYQCCMDFISRKYQLLRATSAEEALTLYLYAKVDAILLGSELELCEQIALTDAMQCSKGKQPIVLLTKVGASPIGTFDASISLPLSQEKLEKVLTDLHV